MIEIPRHALSEFVRCPRKFYYRFKLGLIEKIQPDYITIGSFFHGGIAHFYREWSKGLPKDDEEVKTWFWHGITETDAPYTDEVATLAFDMLWYWWKSPIAKQELSEIKEILAIEETFYLSAGGHNIPWTPDLVIRRKDDGLAIIDHKTVGNIKDSLAFLPADPQLRRYALGGWDMFKELPWLSYNMHRRELPPDYVSPLGTKPYSLTKTGRPSTRSNEVLDYIRRENIIFTPKQLDATRDELVSELIDYDRALVSGNFSRRYIKGGNYGCTKCPYFKPCTRELDGNPLDGITLGMEFDKGETI